MHCIWYQDCGAATRSCAAGSIREGGDRVPEKTDKWFIVTLVIQMGKEEAAKEMLRGDRKGNSPKGGRDSLLEQWPVRALPYTGQERRSG